METKRVTEDFGERGIMQQWTPPDIADIMKEIEAIFEEYDEELVKAEMAPLGYEKRQIIRSACRDMWNCVMWKGLFIRRK